MTDEAFIPYAPLNVPKPVAHDLWIVDGPEIRMRYFGTTLPFPTRMTVVRLPSGGLWLHSPIAWNEALGAALDTLGPVQYLVAPNTLHYWYMPQWQAHFPQARSFALAGLARRARLPLKIDETLSEQSPPDWCNVLDQCIVPGSLLSEADFFHRPSKTLILTDLIENFEVARVRSPLLRWAIKAFGVADPDGKAPIDMQWSFVGHRKSVRAAAQRMISWEPEQIIIAHGRCYHTQAVDELRRAFRWVL